MLEGETRTAMCEKGLTIPVLDKGYVRYIDHLGDDKRIVETARISYKSPSKGEEQDKKLLHYLYKHRHTSPFESVNITFNIKMPIFVMRQFVRHRTFRLNEWSARYSEMADDFYIPSSWRMQDTKNKQGSLSDESFNPEINDIWYCGDPTTSHTSKVVRELCATQYRVYKDMINAGIAKEMARVVLPVNLYTEIYVNCDLHNLMHFLTLRISDHAQYEIKMFAIAMKQIAEILFPWTFEAFDRYTWKLEDDIDFKYDD